MFFSHPNQIQPYYEQSWLSQQNRAFSLRMGKTALGNLLDDPGRRTKRVVVYEQAAISLTEKAFHPVFLNERLQKNI